MMSYLWILLLGSLLATSAKAQDDAATTEEKADSEAPALEADIAAEGDEESTADKETEHTTEEITEPGSPAVEEVEPVDTPAAAADAGADAEATPAADAEATAAADSEATAAADSDADADADADAEATPAAGAEEAEAEATKQDDPEVMDPKAEEPTVLGEEEAASSAGETPAHESESEATPAADPAVADDEDKDTVPTADDAEPTQPDVDGKVEPEVEVPNTALEEEIVPEVKADVEFSLGDALPDEKTEQNPGKRKLEIEKPHHDAVGGEADKPEAEEGGSGSIVAILSAVAVSVGGAIVGFFTYKNKKLCFKNRQEADPEAARKANATEAQSDPQVLSNLLNSS